MKRDFSIIPLSEHQSLLIAADNSGAIGMKDLDTVKTSYDIVAYYSFRVAFMECLSGGGKPISVVLHNFCSDESWDSIMSGVQKGLKEAGYPDIKVTGSTESNFHLLQSALGLVVIGLMDGPYVEPTFSVNKKKFAVIGSPLVGEAVLSESHQVIPLNLFQELCALNGTEILPVGSKGILHELKTILDSPQITKDNVRCEVDLLKTSGPSTCILMAFPSELEVQIKNLTGHLYHPLILSSSSA
jgi:hypothetical protein